MIEAYQDQKDSLLLHPLDVQKSSSGAKKQSEKINVSSTKPSRTTIKSESKPLATSASKTILNEKNEAESSKRSGISGTETSSSQDQPPFGKSPSSTDSAGADAPLAAAIQALSKLDISTLPSKTAVSSQSSTNRESSIPTSANVHGLPLSHSFRGQDIPLSAQPPLVPTKSLASENQSTLAPSVAAIFAFAGKSHPPTSMLGRESNLGQPRGPLLAHPPPQSALLPSPQVPIRG